MKHLKVLEWTKEQRLPVIHRRGYSRNLARALDESRAEAMASREAYFDGIDGPTLIFDTGRFSQGLHCLGKFRGRIIIPPAYTRWVLHERESALLVLRGDAVWSLLPSDIKRQIAREIRCRIIADYPHEPVWAWR